MKISDHGRRVARGYISYLMVMAVGVVLLSMMIASYKASMLSQDTQQEVGLRIDYAEKEEAILRAIVSLTPNRAIGAMRGNSNTTSVRETLTWRAIFSEALDQANARQSVDGELLSGFGLSDHRIANSGDTGFSDVSLVFDAIEPEAGFVAPGIGRSLGVGFPPPLETAVSEVVSRDRVYPIISTEKRYGTLASSGVGLSPAEYPDFNVIPYPEIRFGYAAPGEPFVAKRNWWAFSLDLADADDQLTGMDVTERDFVISIYEIPSQLAISAEAFTVLGEYADGNPWQNAAISGGVFATRARVGDGMNLARLSGRRKLEISGAATIADEVMATDPFAPGVREQFEIDHAQFLPVSLASEAGRAAFIPISRGEEFFDRYLASNQPESDTLSPTTWNEYTVGSGQCAMWLDILEVESETNPSPTKLRFEYLKGGAREHLDVYPNANPVAGLPPGYIHCAVEHETVNFPIPVDVAYGKNGSFYFQTAVSGDVTFNNARFGDPLENVLKDGYYRPSYPFEMILLNGRQSVAVYPQRFEAFLALLGADGPAVNHSLSVNVDHTNPMIAQPSFPSADLDYSVVLKECADLTGFPAGFSLVTNLRLYIGDDFNIVESVPPLGSGIPTPFYPPASLFAPEKRYGAEMDPLHLKLSGQMGSLAGGDASGASEVHLLDVKGGSELALSHEDVQVNLSPIKHPAALPPITMMNWLIVVEERRAEFHAGVSP